MFSSGDQASEKNNIVNQGGASESTAQQPRYAASGASKRGHVDDSIV